MELIIILLALVQSISISLGVGSSTIAIINFFVAIGDGQIDESERRMMGIVYIVLRVAMGLILFTTAVLTAIQYNTYGSDFLVPFVVAVWILIAVLYINAVLMTKKVVSSKIGPALQASSWYTLGILMALFPLGLTAFSLLQFFVVYAIVILLALAVVNGLMIYLKKRSEKTIAA